MLHLKLYIVRLYYRFSVTWCKLYHLQCTHIWSWCIVICYPTALTLMTKVWLCPFGLSDNVLLYLLTNKHTYIPPAVPTIISSSFVIFFCETHEQYLYVRTYARCSAMFSFNKCHNAKHVGGKHSRHWLKGTLLRSCSVLNVSYNCAVLKLFECRYTVCSMYSLKCLLQYT